MCVNTQNTESLADRMESKPGFSFITLIILKKVKIKFFL